MGTAVMLGLLGLAFGSMWFLFIKCTDDRPNEIQSPEIKAWLESGERWQPKKKDGGNGVG